MKKSVKGVILFLFCVIISFFIISKFLYSKINIDDEKVLRYLINNGTNNSFENLSVPNLLDFNNSTFLLKYSLGIETTPSESVMVDLDEVEDISVSGDYVEDPTGNESVEPIIYIYNTHQTEAYNIGYLEPYNIKPTVMLASYMLRERLNDLNLPSMVETSNVSDILNANGWKYGSSYKVSRMLLESAKKNNPTLKYFIDLHRDAGSHTKTTTTIDNEAYAKVLFVVGLEHENYEPNLKLANDLNDLFNKYYPNLSRGVITKSGKGVNGIYNQDFDSNTFLIEIGGEANTIDEVNNTISALSNILFKYVRGEA